VLERAEGDRSIRANAMALMWLCDDIAEDGPAMDAEELRDVYESIACYAVFVSVVAEEMARVVSE
jgi:hypothetical protein